MISGKYRLDSTGSDANGFVYGRRYDVKGVNSRLTYGLLINGSFGNATALKNFWQVGAYFQSGKDRDGKDLSASHYTASLTLQKGKFSFGPGYDYLSGNSSTISIWLTKRHRFDPYMEPRINTGAIWITTT